MYMLFVLIVFSYFLLKVIIMNIFKKIIVANIISLNIGVSVFAANQANQVLTTTLAEVLEIEKIIVEDIDHEKNGNLCNL